MQPLTIKDFVICGNSWTLDPRGECWEGTETPCYIIDSATGKKFLNESREIIVIKCFLLIFYTPAVHSIFSVCNIAYRITRLIAGYHFWPDPNGKTEERKFQLLHVSQDFMRIVATPLAIVGLEFAAIYGIVVPYSGRKLYGSIEQAIYERPIAAPCFQAEPKYHLLGGSINARNVI